MDEFNKWNEVKKITDKTNVKVTLKPREIFWVKIGRNIGSEEFGKNRDFTRPVIILRRLTSDLFVGIPLTSKVKESNDYFHIFEYENRTRGKIKNSAMILQVRTFSIKRVLSKIGVVNKEDFEIIVGKTQKIVTPPKN